MRATTISLTIGTSQERLLAVVLPCCLAAIGCILAALRTPFNMSPIAWPAGDSSLMRALDGTRSLQNIFAVFHRHFRHTAATSVCGTAAV